MRPARYTGPPCQHPPCKASTPVVSPPPSNSCCESTQHTAPHNRFTRASATVTAVPGCLTSPRRQPQYSETRGGTRQVVGTRTPSRPIPIPPPPPLCDILLLVVYAMPCRPIQNQEWVGHHLPIVEFLTPCSVCAPISGNAHPERGASTREDRLRRPSAGHVA